MKNKIKKLVCMTLAVITLVGSLGTTNVQAATKLAPKKHGTISKVEYKAVNYSSSVCSQLDDDYAVTFTNTASYPVRITGKITFYKNGKKLIHGRNTKGEVTDLADKIDLYLYPNQRLTDFYRVWAHNEKIKPNNYKVSYTVKKVSTSEIKKKTKTANGYGAYYPELSNIKFGDYTLSSSDGKYYSNDKALYIDYFYINTDENEIGCSVTFAKDAYYWGYKGETDYGADLWMYDKNGYFLDIKRLTEGAGTFKKGDTIYIDKEIVTKYADYLIDDIATFDILPLSENRNFGK